jgi:hypothetical protein
LCDLGYERHPALLPDPAGGDDDESDATTDAVDLQAEAEALAFQEEECETHRVDLTSDQEELADSDVVELQSAPGEGDFEQVFAAMFSEGESDTVTRSGTFWLLHKHNPVSGTAEVAKLSDAGILKSPPFMNGFEHIAVGSVLVVVGGDGLFAVLQILGCTKAEGYKSSVIACRLSPDGSKSLDLTSLIKLKDFINVKKYKLTAGVPDNNVLGEICTLMKEVKEAVQSCMDGPVAGKVHNPNDPQNHRNPNNPNNLNNPKSCHHHFYLHPHLRMLRHQPLARLQRYTSKP